MYLTTLAGNTYSPSDKSAGISSATSSGLARGGGSPSSSSSSFLPSKSALTSPPFSKFATSSLGSASPPIGIGSSAKKSVSSSVSSSVSNPPLNKSFIKVKSPITSSSSSLGSASPIGVGSSKSPISSLSNLALTKLSSSSNGSP